jgi:hypothetical protein
LEKRVDNEGEEDEINKLKKNTNKKSNIQKEKKLLKEEEKLSNDNLDTEDLK